MQKHPLTARMWESYQAYYSEVENADHTPSSSFDGAGIAKNLTEVRRPQRELVPDGVGLEQYEQTYP